MQIKHVRIEPYQHLRSGLSANATVHIRLARKILRQFPTVGDRVTEENYAPLLRRLGLKSHIVLMVAAYLIPILQLVGEALRGELQAAVCFGRLEFRHELRPHRCGRQESREQKKHQPGIASHRLLLTCIYTEGMTV